ncbi:MAG: hypothetical protein KDC98_12580 [Planctomycetes bacterium]|nr:hypothetical protein [Planctomycetota bacterium]
MFDRFIRLQRARKALREQRFEDALQLAADPLIRHDRQAEDIRDRARDRLLQRGRQRLDEGDLRAAQGLQKRLAVMADNEQVQALAQAIEATEGAAQEVADTLRRVLDEAKALLAAGDLCGAAAVLAGAPSGKGGVEGIAAARIVAEFQRLEKLVDERRGMASEYAAQAEELLERDEVGEARNALARAVAVDREAGRDVRPRLARAAAAMADEAIQRHIDAGDLIAALAEWRAIESDVVLRPAIEWLARPKARIGAALLAALQGAADLAQASALAVAVRDCGFDTGEPLGRLVVALARLGGAGPVAVTVAGDGTLALELRRAAEAVGAVQVASAAAGLADREAGLAVRVAVARERAAAGELDAARQELMQMLADEPMHEAARRELDLVDQGLMELDHRLGAARQAAKDGNLRESCSQLLSLRTTGRVGAEAQLLLADVRARMALVDRGLEETLAALHGRAAGSLQGVRHCLGRLRELAKVQADHIELTRVEAAVDAEVEGLEHLDRCMELIDHGRVAESTAVIDEILKARPRLLAPERLDARLMTIADRLLASAGRAVTHCCSADFEACMAGVEKVAVVDSGLAGKAAAQRREVAERVRGAEACAARAMASLSQRDLAEAERLLEEAEKLWSDTAAVRALADQVQGLRRQSDAIEQVAALARGRDYREASDRLAEMPPTPPLLRTRIFDMKQQLARAQGLEAAFLLRVDEGGEHLVMRGETVSIGNMRQRSADLPILANVAGRHATIRRSMSFHGGMEDVVVAEDGEVRIAGRAVERHTLSPGDRIQFGPSLAMSYQRPTSRSLTVGLVLQGGFQVAGTERVFLMKDRGKDGRILIGPSQDVHVRVDSATGEVEVFTSNSGQVRIGCSSGGTIDGVPFRGEHPVDAGQVVTAAGVTFVLLPWRP